MKLRMRTLSLAGGILAFGLGSPGCSAPQTETKNPTESVAIKAEVLTVTRSLEPEIYVAVGNVKRRLNTVLSAKLMGRVKTVSVKAGDTVSQGQLVVSIDAREQNAAVDGANASFRSSEIGVDNARSVAVLEDRTNQAQILQAEAKVKQAEANLGSVQARYDLAIAGPRPEEVTQAHLVVNQAESSLKLATKELERATRLVQTGALAGKELDLAQNRFDLAKGQYQVAVQAEKIATEGTRSQELRASQEAVVLAQAAIQQSKAALNQARAASLQTDVRRKEIDSARARVQLASASVEAARVAVSDTSIQAPFSGTVVQRFVDAGAMAVPGSPLIALEGGDLLLESIVPERILRFLSVGTKAKVQIDAVRGPSWPGKVVEVVPQGDSVNHTFLVKWKLPEVKGINSGMFGRVPVPIGSNLKILIPSSATWERDGLHYALALDPDRKARIRVLSVGESLDKKTEILAGLNPGDLIVASPHNIPDGTKIEGK